MSQNESHATNANPANESPSQQLSEGPGTLWVTSTPIGNLGDITLRAVDILKSVDLIACEDTRVTRKLLNHIGSDRPTIAYHEHNEKELSITLADRIETGESIALVCDAGTPLLSDPGFRVVRECQRRNLPVSPLPGPSALLAALAASGLPPHAFFYAGFPAPKSAARHKLLTKHADADYTLILYESCHRIAKLAADIETILGPDRVVCICRELTKRFETFLRGPISEVAPKIIGANVKGEFVVIIAPTGYDA
ncbi:16S rRNA (cytidine(1402)-2'-O)-methyltransferase [Rubellicoccus peritrichatus]|uniref:Ribosomal RNA small subunit methyltransferase I n=1 Tax=Rubellicoccus peritrichatus TaxID=3080537 RepID=A0AAQ3LAW6_9BACT|nr:16S rRNA (cytidine(1402)-2'-O)-methyltransferase [Puniceicoccus sp. CR14]WOO42764.1 16S rRNA (cytidine(1402)-2'-O)-methyltransferase [Puniceicoccus sp. CR14]